MTPKKDQKNRGERCVIYCRVSTMKQKKEGLSLEAQEDLCRAYAKNNGFEVARIFSEDESASKAERKKFNMMLGWMQTNDISHLLVEKTDRFHRDMKGESIIKDNKLTTHFIKDGMIFNWKSSSAVQKFMFRVQSAQTAYMADNTGEETIKGTLKKLERGGIVGPTPLGYLPVGGKARKDAEKFDLVRQVFDQALKGKNSYENLAKYANSIGLTSKSGKPIGKSDIHRMMTDTFYYGTIHRKWEAIDCEREFWPNTGIDGNLPPSYEAMTSEEEFNQLQGIFSGRRNNWTTERGRDFLFKGIFKCARCGRSLLGEAKTVTLKSQEEKRIVYYHCSQGHYFVDSKGEQVPKEYIDSENLVTSEDIYSEDMFYLGGKEEVIEKISLKKGSRVERRPCKNMPWYKEEYLEEEILHDIGLIIDPKAMEIVRKKLGEKYLEIRDTSKQRLTYLRKQKTEIEGKIQRLYQHFDSGKIDDDFYQSQYQLFKTQHADFSAEEKELERAQSEPHEKTVESLELYNFFKKKYLASDMEKKNAMLRLVYRTIYADRPKKKYPYSAYLYFIYNEPFRTFIEEGIIKISDELAKEGIGKFPDFEKWLLG